MRQVSEEGREIWEDLMGLRQSQLWRTKARLWHQHNPWLCAIPHALGRLEPASILCGEGLKGL